MLRHKYAEGLATLVYLAEHRLLFVVRTVGANYLDNLISIWAIVTLNDATREALPILSVGDSVNFNAIATLDCTEEIAHGLSTTQSQSFIVLLFAERRGCTVDNDCACSALTFQQNAHKLLNLSHSHTVLSVQRVESRTIIGKSDCYLVREGGCARARKRATEVLNLGILRPCPRINSKGKKQKK